MRERQLWKRASECAIAAAVILAAAGTPLSASRQAGSEKKAAAGEILFQPARDAVFKDSEIESGSGLSRQAGSLIPESDGWLGKLEVEVHYSSWGLNAVKSLFEKSLLDEVGEEIRDELTKEVRKKHPYVLQGIFEQQLSFDSEGSNYGIGLRFYPRGPRGAFSIGFSLEKTRIEIALKGPLKQTYANGTSATVESTAYLKASPLSTNMNFRWDFMPSWRVTPYFVIGFGLASLEGTAGYAYSGKYVFDTLEDSIEGRDEKTFKETEEESDINLPNIFPLFQLCLGARVEIVRGLSFRAEAGLWDGVLLRGGLGYRF